MNGRSAFFALLTCSAVIGGAAAMLPLINVPATAAQFPGGAATAPMELVAKFDRNGNDRLDADERRAAREYIEAQGSGRAGRGRGGRGAGLPGEPGLAIDPTSVERYPANAPFYGPAALRTLFLTFENDDWERELAAFKDTDVEVTASLVVDGVTYRDVGVRFRGASSFFTVPEGRKRSLNISLDFVHANQNIQGFRTLNLLNAHSDPTYMRAILYLQIAREYIAAPRGNFVRVAINGEHWGVYSNVEQFNKDFVSAWFKTDEGARWKVPGSPNGRGGLEYLGDDPAPYKRLFEIKSKDNPQSWAWLIALTKALNETPLEQLETALSPILDIESTLKFLALENVLVNNDGYWTRASDYDLYRHPSGKFYLFPHDTNETFAIGGGRGGRGGAGGGVNLDLLAGMNDPSKPLRSRLLAVPSLRAKYLAYCREIASQWLDWNRLEPIVTAHQALIAKDVQQDTRKLDTFAQFQAGATALKSFADARRTVVLSATQP